MGIKTKLLKRDSLFRKAVLHLSFGKSQRYLHSVLNRATKLGLAFLEFLLSFFGLERRPRSRDASLRSTRLLAADFVEDASEGVVQAGPFCGMKLSRNSLWGVDGDYVAKITGFYEQEIHRWLEDIDKLVPEVVVNFGCADGYYAVGFALKWPEAEVVGVDISLPALAEARNLASLNEVNCQIRWTNEFFDEEKFAGQRVLWLVDVEGAELALLSPRKWPSFNSAIVIVELHDFDGLGVTKERANAAWGESHHVTFSSSSSRNPNSSSLLKNLPDDEKWLAMSEGRPSEMTWALLRPKNTIFSASESAKRTIY